MNPVIRPTVEEPAATMFRNRLGSSTSVTISKERTTPAKRRIAAQITAPN